MAIPAKSLSIALPCSGHHQHHCPHHTHTPPRTPLKHKPQRQHPHLQNRAWRPCGQPRQDPAFGETRDKCLHFATAPMAVSSWSMNFQLSYVSSRPGETAAWPEPPAQLNTLIRPAPPHVWGSSARGGRASPTVSLTPWKGKARLPAGAILPGTLPSCLAPASSRRQEMQLSKLPPGVSGSRLVVWKGGVTL